MNSAHYNSQISMHLFYSVCVGKKWQLIYFNLIRIYKYLTINGREKVPWNHLSKQALTTVLIINCWHRDMSGCLFFLRKNANIESKFQMAIFQHIYNEKHSKSMNHNLRSRYKIISMDIRITNANKTTYQIPLAIISGSLNTYLIKNFTL